MHRIRFCFYLVATLMICGSCSLARFAYDRAAWLAMIEIDSQFDLNSEQEEALEPLVKKWVGWFKSQQIPHIIEILRSVKGLTTKKVEPSDISRIYSQMVKIRLETVLSIAPEASYFLSDLKPMQLDHHENKLRERNDILEELVTSSEEDFENLLDDLLQKRADRISSWVGELDEKQFSLLDPAPGKHRTYFREVLEWRKGLQNHWLNILNDNSTASEVESALKTWAVNISQISPPAKRIFYQQRREARFNRLAQLLNSLTVGQKEHFLKKIDFWLETVSELSG